MAVMTGEEPLILLDAERWKTTVCRVCVCQKLGCSAKCCELGETSALRPPAIDKNIERGIPIRKVTYVTLIGRGTLPNTRFLSDSRLIPLEKSPRLFTRSQFCNPPEKNSSTLGMAASTEKVNEILNEVPHLRRGTGGVAAVVKDGKVVGKKAWGYADLDQRIPMTTQTVFPICSISKQMVCLAMQSLLQKPTASMSERKESPEEQMEAELHKLLPHLKGAKGGDDLKVADLYNMQSGIRDYWAM